ncbi:pilus assembly protein PilP [Chitinimonas arctica]|uniref:Pilus assembly protein PilP n=1 Tax=Chitinimonas arctica TaxID=2594795 RepID=A0A516SEM8_9NEIS|nr:pilus assembly protein PilP [Chitinimonas arctica]QDQ26617.1 pilus assembly protein PilP [Chitinimonas arctica]
MNRSLATCLATSLFLFGCAGEEFGDLKAWMDETTGTLKSKIEPLPEVKPYQPFIYSAFDLVDPFNRSKMEVAKKAGGALAPNLSRPKETLEAYDLEKLRMVGTLQKGKEINALIRTPDGNLYRVKMGSYMGQNFGMVTAISDTDITLKEIVEDSGGDWVERTSVLALEDTEQKK